MESFEIKWAAGQVSGTVNFVASDRKEARTSATNIWSALYPGVVKLIPRGSKPGSVDPRNQVNANLVDSHGMPVTWKPES